VVRIWRKGKQDAIVKIEKKKSLENKSGFAVSLGCVGGLLISSI
jgi:hypothetical protein